MKIRKYLNINTTKELTLQLGLSLDNLSRVVLDLDKYYIFREKVKDKKGKPRDFYEAKGELKIIHSRIDKNLLDKIYYPETIQGGVKSRSILTNAQYHTGKKYVANFDISKFFPSVRHKVVYNAFISQKCAPNVARLLTILTTADDQLPQGFKTSPKISGLVLREIDERLKKLLEPKGLVYTFWIDDLTISGDYPITKLKKIIEKIFTQCGFKLNTKKTYIASRNSRTKKQVCTGLTVNRGTNTSKEFRKKAKKELYLCEKFGVKNYLDENNIIMDEKNYLWSLKGRVSFLASINQKYKDYQDRVLKIEAKTLKK